jgi:hypothetical protein
MSATLDRALAAGDLKVRKLASGEAIVVFNNPVVKTGPDGEKFTVKIGAVRISHSHDLDLFSRKDVDREAVKQSNIRTLVESGILEVV